MVFEYGTFTLFGTPFQGVSSNQTLSKCSPSAGIPRIYPKNAPDAIFLQPPAFYARRT